MADLSITAANVVKYSNATTRTGTAGAAITAGDVLYLDTTLKLADTDTAAKATAVGIALNDAAIGQPVVYLVAGGINPGATVAIGTYYVISATAGNICPVADLVPGDYCTGLGWGTTTSRIEVNINVSGVAIPAPEG